MRSAQVRLVIGVVLLIFCAGGAVALTALIFKWRELTIETARLNGEMPLKEQISASDRQLLVSELQKILSKREPLATVDTRQWHEAGCDQVLTARWMDALQPLSKEMFDDDRIPGWYGITVEMPKDQEGRQRVDEVLRQTAHSLAQIDALALEPGEVRFPMAFEQGSDMLLSWAERSQAAGHALRLRLYRALADGDDERAVRSLMASFSVGQALHADPAMVCCLVRAVIHGNCLRDLEMLLSENRLSDDRLDEFYTRVNNIDYERQLQRVCIGERAVYWHDMHFPVNLEGHFIGFHGPQSVGSDPTKIRRQKDAAFVLALYADGVAASQRRFPQCLDEFAAVARRIESLKSLPREDRLDYHSALVFMPAFEHFAGLIGIAIARRNLVATHIRIEQFFREHQRWPEALDELPEAAANTLADPFSTVRLQYRLQDDGWILYSVGRNRQDDQGQEESDTAEPDIVTRRTNRAVGRR